MYIEVLGKKPTTKCGEQFCRNIYCFGVLAGYSITVAPDICAPIRYQLGDNLGEGLDDAAAVALADALQTEIDAGRTADYAALVHPKDTSKYGLLLEGPPGNPHPFVQNVTAFAAFLRESGGFEIW
jgi:hypothetical protein